MPEALTRTQVMAARDQQFQRDWDGYNTGWLISGILICWVAWMAFKENKD